MKTYSFSLGLNKLQFFFDKFDLIFFQKEAERSEEEEMVTSRTGWRTISQVHDIIRTTEELKENNREIKGKQQRNQRRTTEELKENYRGIKGKQ